MRIPRTLAWILLLSGFFTAGLLRTYHLETPRSPWVPVPVGSLLFASLLFLLLVAARERRTAGVPGPGIRLGSLTPFFSSFCSRNGRRSTSTGRRSPS